MQLVFPPIVLMTTALALCSAADDAPRPVDIYLAPTGNDTNPGTRQEPLATLARARDVVRQQKNENPDSDVTVFLRGGVYRLTDTVVFTLGDSGGPGRTITYAAFPGETPILCSDVQIGGWKKLEAYPDQLPRAARGNVWVADASALRELKEKQIPSRTVATQMDRTRRFFTLYQGDRRLPRARGPSMSLSQESSQEGTDESTFVFPTGTIRNWPDIAEAEISFIPRRSWINFLLPIKDVDESKGIAHTRVPATYELDWRGEYVEDSGCWIENVLAVLDEPGEWVLDGRTDTLYLWPPDGQPGNDIVAPALTELIRVEGDIDYQGPTDVPVTNIVFQGLTFTRGDRFPWHGRTGWGVQHDWERFDSPSALVRFRGSRNCEVLDCHLWPGHQERQPPEHRGEQLAPSPGRALSRLARAFCVAKRREPDRAQPDPRPAVRGHLRNGTDHLGHRGHCRVLSNDPVARGRRTPDCQAVPRCARPVSQGRHLGTARTVPAFTKQHRGAE